MTAPITKPAFAHLIPADTFKAWRILGTGKSEPIDVSSATTIEEAIQTAALSCRHKDHFSVLHTTAGGSLIEHVCYVKQGKPRWINKPGFAHPVQIKPLEAEVRFFRTVQSLAPVEPWRWEPGCDVVGHDRSEIDA